jgi:hypothetical protein
MRWVASDEPGELDRGAVTDLLGSHASTRESGVPKSGEAGERLLARRSGVGTAHLLDQLQDSGSGCPVNLPAAFPLEEVSVCPAHAFSDDRHVMDHGLRIWVNLDDGDLVRVGSV